jgi:hypothetical protein
MGWAAGFLQNMLRNEPPVGPAVERRKVGVEDEVVSNLPDSEFPHVFEQEKVDGGPGQQEAGVGQKDSKNGHPHGAHSSAAVYYKRKPAANSIFMELT